MYSQEMYGYGAQSSVIREIFTYGQKRKAQIGNENVYDYSLGNPSVAPPQIVTDTFIELLQTRSPLQLHGYTAAVGDTSVRQAIADDLNGRFKTNIKAENLYMTCGAAASLKIVLCALFEEGDEALTFTPFFPEYRVFAETAGYKFTAVKSEEGTFQPDFSRLEAAINEKTKVIIVNSPNNPSGVIYSRENIIKLTEFLSKKEKEYGHPIFLLSDEPYRELSYGTEVPFIPCYYNNTIVCYSYSKSLSLPGDRIGYICVPETVIQWNDIFTAVCGAGRCLGYVCAPALLQQLVGKCTNARPDLNSYRENRDLLYESLTQMGYECIYPDGAFYLCMKTLEPDAGKFYETAKKYELLLVPGDSFSAPGYVRLSYCVSNDMIKRSLPAFKKLMEEYNNKN